MRKLYPVSVSCEVLEVSASGYFNWLRRRESGHGGPARRHSDEALLAQSARTESGSFGAEAFWFKSGLHRGGLTGELPVVVCLSFWGQFKAGAVQSTHSCMASSMASLVFLGVRR